jgi:hypothetical protein
LVIFVESKNTMGQFSMQEAMQLFLQRSKLKPGIQSLQIEEVWSNLMGKTIAGYTDKIELLGNRLIIHTRVAPLKNELEFQKDKIIERVNEALGEKVVESVWIK